MRENFATACGNVPRSYSGKLALNCGSYNDGSIVCCQSRLASNLVEVELRKLQCLECAPAEQRAALIQPPFRCLG